VKNLILFILLITIQTSVNAQNDSTQTKPNYNDSLITISGRVVDTTQKVNFYNVMVINKTAGKGIFGKYDGTFSIQVKKSDLVAVSVTGYQTKYLNFKNSKYKKEYKVTLYLEILTVTSKEVVVKPLKTLEELQKERAQLQKRELPKVTITSALQSPITALYMAFSKREKTKRLIAEMEFKDQQKEVVKEILRVYVANDIIDLEDDEFEAFINFLNLNDYFLKTATDYELIMYIKGKYQHFKKLQTEGF
jgi:RNase P/RNase MRP subunit p29